MCFWTAAQLGACTVQAFGVFCNFLMCARHANIRVRVYYLDEDEEGRITSKSSSVN